MKTEVYVLMAVICLAIVALLGFAAVGYHAEDYPRRNGMSTAEVAR